MDEQENMQEDQEFFQSIQKKNGFKFAPCNEIVNLGDERHFKKLNLSSGQKMQMNELMQHIPAMAAAGAMSGAYTVRFPNGLPHTLVSLKQGGFGSQIVENKRFVGSASFYSMSGQAAVLGVFTAMSIATGQFFLSQINKELNMINMKLDEILKFLYGEKRAELLSEVSFIKYAYENYASIMEHDAQRIATIGSIQEAKKIAMKDIEFYEKYLADKISSVPSKKFLDLVEELDKEIEPSRENLYFSLQLYLMSSLMEVYYAQNYEDGYIENLGKEMKNYVKGFNDQMMSNYGAIIEKLNNCSIPAKNKREARERRKKLEDLKTSIGHQYNTICENINTVLHTATKGAEYYIKADGEDYNVYYKVS